MNHYHSKTISVKTNKTLYLLRKLQNPLPRVALIILYKSFIRPYLDYGDIIYEQAFNSSFQEKLESIQCNASLAITGAIIGTSREKLYNELGLESLHARRWYRKLCYFYKFCVFIQPEYLFNLIPVRTSKMQMMYQTLTSDIFFSKILFSHLRLLNGINWTLDFEKSKASLILRKIFRVS